MASPNMNRSDIKQVTIQTVRGCLVASIQIELDDATLRQFRSDILDYLKKNEVRGAILDVSGVSVMDSYEFRMLRDTLRMAEVMATPSVMVGLQPGVVSALLDMDVDLQGLQTALNLEAAFDLLQPPETPEVDVEDEEKLVSLDEHLNEQQQDTFIDRQGQ